MPIEQGEKVPTATLKQMTADGIKDLDLATLLAGKKVILFGLPGAYTPVCSTSHLPGYVAEADTLKAEGVAGVLVIGVPVGDPVGAEPHGLGGHEEQRAHCGGR